METDAEGVSPLSSIRAQLEPCCDYILFEAAEPGPVDWQPIMAVVEPFRSAILAQRQHRDELTGRAWLLVQLDPHRSDEVKDVVMAMKPMRDIVVYFYNRISPPSGSSRN